MVLIPKGKREYRGGGLVEVTWKVVAVILNLRLTTGITFNNALHGFREGRGTGTATLEAKLLQKLAAMRDEVLYVIFLDLTKAYNALDRSRSLEILNGYGLGDRVLRLLREYLDKTTMVARAGEYYRKVFKGGRGVTRGDPLSPTIFNVVVDDCTWLNTNSPLLDATSHPFRCSARILDGPPNRFLCSVFTASAISSFVGTESSISDGVTVTGILSPGGGTLLYSSTRSAVIRSSIVQAGGRALFTAALYHPFICRHASFAFGGSPPSSSSTSFPASSTLRFLSPFRLSLKARPSLRSLVLTLAPLFAETLSLASLHVSLEIHVFLCFSRSCGFGNALRRSPKSLCSLVGSFGGFSGIFRRPFM